MCFFYFVSYRVKWKYLILISGTVDKTCNVMSMLVDLTICLLRLTWHHPVLIICKDILLRWDLSVPQIIQVNNGISLWATFSWPLLHEGVSPILKSYSINLDYAHDVFPTCFAKAPIDIMTAGKVHSKWFCPKCFGGLIK